MSRTSRNESETNRWVTVCELTLNKDCIDRNEAVWTGEEGKKEIYHTQVQSMTWSWQPASISLPSVNMGSSLLKHSMAAISGPFTARHPLPSRRLRKFLCHPLLPQLTALSQWQLFKVPQLLSIPPCIPLPSRRLSQKFSLPSATAKLCRHIVSHIFACPSISPQFLTYLGGLRIWPLFT